jgi:glycosyltransferase involved in cell wall biosynthesis
VHAGSEKPERTKGEMPTISVIIPWQDRGDRERGRCAEFVIGYYERLGIGEVVVGAYPADNEPLNRSRLRNNGARSASGDILFFCDADTLVPEDQVLAACRAAAEQPGAVLPFDRWRDYATPAVSEALLSGRESDPSRFIGGERRSYYVDGAIPEDWCVGPAFAIRAEDFWSLGGFDEAYVGFGEEEKDLLWRTRTLIAELRTVPGGCLHLNYWGKEGPTPQPAWVEGTVEHQLLRANEARYRSMKERIRRAGREPVIAVYSIALNEEQHVGRWADSAALADQRILVDTGSSDATTGKARELGITVQRITISPWRFDDARNAALALVPPDVDICVPLDLDEVLMPGWREALTEAWRAGAERFRFDYVFSWNDDGTPRLRYLHDKIHARHGFRWVHPAHETLAGDGDAVMTAVRVEHRPDADKPRTQYLKLLETGYHEQPKSPRALYYFARELSFANRWEQSRRLFLDYLDLAANTNRQERSEAMLYLARMVWPELREPWLLKACAEAPNRRECWHALMSCYLEQGRQDEARGVAARLLSITTRDHTNSFNCTAEAWDDALIRRLGGLAGADDPHGS